MSEKENRNAGGINGLGTSLINTNSKEFKALQAMIKEVSSAISGDKQLENAFLSIRFQMEAYLNEEHPEKIIPAGAFLKEFIEALKIKQKDFAKYIGHEPSNFNALLNGRRKINSGLAIKLGNIFKVAPAIWLHIQAKNELIREARKKREKFDKYSLDGLLKEVD